VRAERARVTPDELVFLRAWQERSETVEHQLVLAKEYLERIRDFGHPGEARMARQALSRINQEDRP